MNAERLLAHYAEIAEGPDAVAQLRMFVRDLAVRGKLAAQDPSDEPAFELVKRISTEKARLERNGSVRRQEPFKASARIDGPFEIPKTWEWVPAIFPAHSVSDYESKVQTKDVLSEGKYPVVDQGKIPVRGYCNDDERVIRVSDAIIVFGDHTREVKFVDFDFVVGADGVKLLRPIGIFARYYHLALQWVPIDARGYGRHYKLLRAAFIPLPPTEEQHRIVAKVDELMTLCDELEAARAIREAARDRLATASFTRLNAPAPETFQSDARFALDTLPALTTRPDQIKLLRRTILNLAWRAKLAPQDVNDEPASMLLVRIAAERGDLVSNGHLRRERPLDPIPASQVPFDIPPTWCWARVGDTVLFTQYGTSEKASASQDGVPVLTMGNIQEGRVTWGNEKRIPENSQELPALLLRKLDLLYNRTNSAELVGKTGIYLGDDSPRTFASYLIRLRPSLAWTDPRYLNIAMNTPEFRDTQIIPLIKKQTGQANVNGTALKNMLIPLPPLAEQYRIVTKVDQLMTFCDELEASLKTADATRKRLLEALLAEALAPATRDLEAA